MAVQKSSNFQPSGNQNDAITPPKKRPVYSSNIVTATNFSASGAPDLADVNPNGRTNYDFYNIGQNNEMADPTKALPADSDPDNDNDFN